jgi:3-deoxy-D-manno-octulosonate 8-phosphate phosphatase (KDO 8-P phosphatase)
MTTSSQPDPSHCSLLALDCDGVLTNGTIGYDGHGVERKFFHLHDGFAIRAWIREGGKVVVVTGRHSPALCVRMAELGVTEVHENVSDKNAKLQEIIAAHGLSSEQVAFMGDDLPDLPAFSACGFTMAPFNAAPEVRERADFVSTRSGGDGAVREAIEHLMRASGRWSQVVSRFVDQTDRI